MRHGFPDPMSAVFKTHQKFSAMATLTKAFLSEFITMYKEESCLWKVRGSEYSNRTLRNAAVDRLLFKMKEADPDATHDTVRKKINSFRTVFRKEHRKVLRSRLNGHVHRPTLWYYDLLLFLADQYDPHRSRTKPSDVTSREIKVEEDSDDSSYDDEGGLSDPPLSPTSSSSTTTMATTSSHNAVTARDEEVYTAKTKKRPKRGTKTHRHRHADEDFFSVMAKNWGNKMRNISRENPLMAKIAEKLIGEIFFEADMGTLTKKSFVVNPAEQEYSISASSL